MQDDDDYAGVTAALLLLAFVVACVVALKTSHTFIEHHGDRPQSSIVATTASPVLIPAPSHEAEKINMPEPEVMTTDSGQAIDMAAPELKPSVDLPQESIHAEDEKPEAAGREAEPQPRHHARHAHRHAGRRLRHGLGRRDHHRAGCNPDPGCPFLTDAARAGGMIQ